MCSCMERRGHRYVKKGKTWTWTTKPNGNASTLSVCRHRNIHFQNALSNGTLVPKLLKAAPARISCAVYLYSDWNSGPIRGKYEVNMNGDGLPWASEARLLHWSWHYWFFLPHLLVLNRHISHHLLYLRYFPFILHSCSCLLYSCPFILLARLSILVIQGLACLVQCLRKNTKRWRYRLHLNAFYKGTVLFYTTGTDFHICLQI